MVETLDWRFVVKRDFSAFTKGNVDNGAFSK